MAFQNEISRLDVLVHPFCTIKSGFFSARGQHRLMLKELSKKWGRRILELKKDPASVLVIVKTVPDKKLGKTAEFLSGQEQKLIDFASRQLGQRVFVFERTFPVQSFQREAAERGFLLQKKSLHGEIFGEYEGVCLWKTHRDLPGLLGVPQENFSINPKLSVSSPRDYSDFAFQRRFKKLVRARRKQRVLKK